MVESELNEIPSTEPLPAGLRTISSPETASQIRIHPLAEPLAIRLPPGVNARDVTSPADSPKRRSLPPFVRSTRVMPANFRPPMASVSPSGERAVQSSGVG